MKGNDGIENPAFEPPTPVFGGRRRASPAGAGVAAEAPPVEEAEEGPCGWGRCTPKVLQLCNTPEGYLAAYSLLAIFQGNPPRRASGCPQVLPFSSSAGSRAGAGGREWRCISSPRCRDPIVMLSGGEENTRGLDGEADRAVLLIIPNSVLIFLYFFFLPTSESMTLSALGYCMSSQSFTGR